MINWSEIQNARGMFEPRRELKKRLNEPQQEQEMAAQDWKRTRREAASWAVPA